MSPAQKSDGDDVISILLVDDIPEARENIKKLLAFEPDFQVVGGAGTGREGVELAKEFEPDIIIMDINMPDMDGLEATSIINKSVPTAAVIIMSVQNDQDYMRRAMLSGARDFLTKPVNMDELYNTIRTVYKTHEPIRHQYAQQAVMPLGAPTKTKAGPDHRAGNVIVIYSPKGGTGVTTIATSLASGLMKDGMKSLIVDANLQFADVHTFLALQAQSTLVELAPDADDMDIDLFENIVVTHDSGLKVLVGPSRPEFADEIPQDSVAKILSHVRENYDFIVVDTNRSLTETVLSIFEIASKILIVTTPTLASVKHTRFVLDVFDKLSIPTDKTAIILNKVWDERRGKSPTISAERVENYLKRPVIGKIPSVDERMLLSAINKGLPVIAADRDQSKPPIRQLVDLSNEVYKMLMGEDDDGAEEAQDGGNKRFSIFGR